MPIYKCNYCGNNYLLDWEDVFDNHDYKDGENNEKTYIVRDVLINAGYQVELDQKSHDETIISIKKDGKELMPFNDDTIHLSFDVPREYLPEEVIDLLDNYFSSCNIEHTAYLIFLDGVKHSIWNNRSDAFNQKNIIGKYHNLECVTIEELPGVKCNDGVYFL